MGNNWCHTWRITGGLPVSCIRQNNTVNELAAGLLPLAMRLIVVGAGEAVQPRGLGVGNCDCGVGHCDGDMINRGLVREREESVTIVVFNR